MIFVYDWWDNFYLLILYFVQIVLLLCNKWKIEVIHSRRKCIYTYIHTHMNTHTERKNKRGETGIENNWKMVIMNIRILQYHKLYNKVISVSPYPYSILVKDDHLFDLIILWHIHNISKYSENSGRHNFHDASCFNAFPDWISRAPTWLMAVLFLFSFYLVYVIRG